MSIKKRLVIKASTTYESEEFQILPVNGQFIKLQTSFGSFALKVDIKNFDGSKPHLSNSFYNLGDETHLDNETTGKAYPIDDKPVENPNVRIEYHFTPNKDIGGESLVFGNDFTYPIRDFLPTSILQTGLKFFTWFISKTVKGDVFGDKPFLYGLALNSFTFITEAKEKDKKTTGIKNSQDINYLEVLDSSSVSSSANSIPSRSLERRKHFNNLSQAKEFTFKKDVEYILQFDTNYVKMADSNYAVLIPTFAGKSFDIHVLQFANDTLNNFNWILKVGGNGGVGEGELGIVLNFALLDEEEESEPLVDTN